MNSIINLFQTCIVPFFIAFAACFTTSPIVIWCIEKFKLYDKPDERKNHTGLIPTLGGISIFSGIIIAMLCCMPIVGNLSLLAITGSLILLLATGLADDILNISPFIRLFIQLLIATTIFAVGIRINNMHGLFGITELPLVAQYLITSITIVGIINAFNLIDGIDGLASGLGTLQAFFLAAFLFQKGNLSGAVISIMLMGSLAAFLWYNFSPARIFMGDTGSTLIGFLIAVLSIQFIQVTNNSTITNSPVNPAVTAFSITALPILDCLRVFATRLLNGTSPFKADRTHIHHLLINQGLTHKEASLILYFTNVTMVLMAAGLKHLPEWFSIIGILTIYIVLVSIFKIKENTSILKIEF